MNPGERLPSIDPEVLRKMDIDELALGFAESRGKDRLMGAEIMRRTVEKCDLDPGFLKKPLKSRDGHTIFNEDGLPALVEDYLTCKTGAPPGAALFEILDFLRSDAKDPSFVPRRDAIKAAFNKYT